MKKWAPWVIALFMTGLAALMLTARAPSRSSAPPVSVEKPPPAPPAEKREEGRMGSATGKKGGKEGVYGTRGPSNADAHLHKRLGVDGARSAGVLGALKAQSPADIADEFGNADVDRVLSDKAGGSQAVRGKNRPAGVDTPAEPNPRAWFPETFLFAPLVVTDKNGKARVAVRVPDRLTNWRVLALGHSRGGNLGGATTRFLGTLPIYVDLVVPRRVRTGDVVSLPIQVVNTTNEPAIAELHVVAEGAMLELTQAPFKVGAGETLVQYATLLASQPGPVTLKVRLGRGEATPAGSPRDLDTVVRTLEVEPLGRQVTETRSGSLAAPRTLQAEAPAGAEPGSGRLRLRVFPGALGLLRNELSASLDREGPADDAYALKLAADAPRLLASFGDKADPEALHRVVVLAGQRALQHTRTFQVTSAAILTEAALGHPDNPMLARLAERLLGELERNQRPDGTFGGGSGWTLQRVLLTTAECVRAVSRPSAPPELRHRALAVRLRAQGAIERNLDRIDDPYTAAAILASGAVEGQLADALRPRVLQALRARDDGTRYLPVPDGVVRADGSRPEEAESTALAILALTRGGGSPAPADASITRAVLLDLGASVLAKYTPAGGFGDGRSSYACLAAVLTLFNEPIPQTVNIVLSHGGKAIAQGSLNRDRVKEVLVLEAPLADAQGPRQLDLRAEPAVPGIGFALELVHYVAWQKRPAEGGIELELKTRGEPRVGQPVEVQLVASAPPGLPMTIQQALPAGVQPDTASLDGLVRSGKLERYENHDRGLTLFTRPVASVEPLALSYRVIPTLAGRLSSGAATLTVGRARFDVPPSVWTVR